MTVVAATTRTTPGYRSAELAAVAEALATGGETAALVQFLVEAACSAVGAGAARLEVLQDSGTEPPARRLVAASGGGRLPVGTVRSLDDGAGGWTLRTGLPMIVTRASTGQVEPAGASGRITPFGGQESAICVPLRSAQGVIGVLSVLAEAAGSFDRADLELLELFAALATDVASRLEAEQAQALRLRSQALALDQVSEGMIYVDRDERILRANLAFAALLGADREDLIGRDAASVLGPDCPWAVLEAQLAGRRELRAEAVLRSVTGSSVDVELQLLVVDDEGSPGATHTLVIAREPTGGPRPGATVVRHARTDLLTGLENRRSVLERITAAIHAPSRRCQVALVVVSLDRFRKVNEALGHSGGDALLVAVSARFAEAIGDRLALGRLGGDEFAVVVDELGLAEGLAVAERLAASLAEPIRVGGRSVVLTASIGIAVTDDSSDPTSLLRDADSAVFRAKSGGGDASVLFERAERDWPGGELRVEEDLRAALAGGQLRIAIQPVYDLRSGRLDGFEALVRWQHPERGLLLPGEFLPVAEASGLIGPIGAWVLAESARLVAPLHRARPHLTLGVNVSPRQLASDQIVGHLDRAVAESGLPATALCLEVTESLAMRPGFERTLHQLRARGVRIAIDDLGTGYSNLGYLKHLPVSTLKVDQSFVRDVGTDGRDRAIVEAILGLGASLGLGVIAEGIETVDQLRVLRELGCACGQGDLLGAATPVAEVPPGDWPARLDVAAIASGR